jgi:hypothetical protein
MSHLVSDLRLFSFGNFILSLDDSHNPQRLSWCRGITSRLKHIRDHALGLDIDFGMNPLPLLDAVSGGPSEFIPEHPLPVADDSFRDLLHSLCDSHRGLGAVRVIRLPEGFDALLLLQVVSFLKLFVPPRLVDGICSSSGAADERKARNIAWAIGDVHHILKRDAPRVLGNCRIHVDLGKFVAALVDLEWCAGLGGVVPGIGDLAHIAGIFVKKSMRLFKTARFCRCFGELAGLHIIHMRGNAAPHDHSPQAGTHDVVFNRDLVLREPRILRDAFSDSRKNARQAGVEIKFAASSACGC